MAAGVKPQLQSDATRVGDVRLLPGHFMVIEQAMGVPKGRVAAQSWLSAFIEEMKASGFVAEALTRHGIEVPQWCRARFPLEVGPDGWLPFLNTGIGTIIARRPCSTGWRIVSIELIIRRRHCSRR